jgi:hypothetical protein
MIDSTLVYADNGNQQFRLGRERGPSVYRCDSYVAVRHDCMMAETSKHVECVCDGTTHMPTPERTVI